MNTVIKKATRLASIHKQNIFLFISVFLLLPLFTFGMLAAAHTFDHILTDKEAAAVQQSFARELQMTLTSTEAAARDESMRQAIANNDATSTRALLKDLAAKYSLTGMVAVNKDGIAVARLASPKRGDFVGLTTPWGHAAMAGKEMTTMGIGRGRPLLINSAVPIMRDGEVQGALIGSQILDNAYALRFSQDYLKSGEQVAFYSTRDGISGSSFEDQGTQHLLNIYFNKGSDVIQGLLSGRLPDHFLVQNVLFHMENIEVAGPDGNRVGGILLFSPMRVGLFYLILFISGMMALLLVLLLLRRRHRAKRFAYKAGIITVAAIVIAGSSVFYRNVLEQSIFKIIKPQFAIYNSTIELNPGSDVLDLSDEQRVAIQVTSGGESINTVSAHLHYNPLLIQTEDILIDNSFCDPKHLIEKKIDNQKGEVAVSCIKPNGFFADRAILAELLIQPVRIGQLDMRFEPETQVLANDGLGTDVLRTADDGSYQIVDSKAGKREDASALFSYSHPNQNHWYNNKNISINWARAADNESFSYALDQTLDTIPGDTQVTVNTSVTVAVKQDGIYYFHLKPRYADGTGPVSHLKIMVDTTPPNPPTIKSSVTDVNVGEILRLELSNNGDTPSGLQRNFYVQFDGGVWLPSLPQLSIPFLDAGIHKIAVRVFDNAGNFTDSSTEITVH